MDIKYKVIVTSKAKYDLEEIYHYISKSLMEENTASNLMKNIEESIKKLEYFPEAYSVIEQYQGRDYEYRKLIIKNYLVVYRIDQTEEKVYVIRVVYGGRNYLSEL